MRDFFDSNIFIQLIGFIALCLMIAVFQVNKRSKLLTLQVAAALLFTVHFFLLGAFSGAAMNLLGALRSYTFLKMGNSRDLKYLFVFILAFCVATSVVWQGPKSLLPLMGMIMGTLAFWQIKPGNVRIIALFSGPPWFIYSLISGSIPGMAIELIIFTSNITGIIRHDIIRARAKKRRRTGAKGATKMKARLART